MKIIHKSLKNGIKLKPETADDLWHLSNIIEEGDRVSGKTERKIKIGDPNDRKQRVDRKIVYLELDVEKVEFQDNTNILRIKGKVTQGPEEVTTGSYHTFNVEEGSVIKIDKEFWPKYHLQKLDQASKAPGRKILIACHDRQNASFGLLTGRGLEELGSIEGEVQKKRVEGQKSGDFYKDVVKNIEMYNERHQPQHIVLASPGFWKDYVNPLLPEELSKKVVGATCSTVGERGLQEVVKRPELKQVLEEDRTRKEGSLLEDVMKAISDDKACYGYRNCREKVMIGAVEDLLVSENFLVRMRKEEKDRALETLMKKVEEMDGNVHIVEGDEEKAKLDNLGGIAGVMRWEA